MKQLRIYSFLLAAFTLAFGDAGATAEAGYDIGVEGWRAAPFHAGMNLEEFRNNVVGNPHTMSGVEYSQGKYEGTDDTAAYDAKLQAYHDANPEGYKSLHDHLEALRGPAYDPGTVEAAKPLHDFLRAATGSATFTYTPERTKVRATPWINNNNPWRDGLAGAYPRAFLVEKDSIIQGMFSFALDIPKPEETRAALVHVFALLNPEHAAHGVMTHAVGTIAKNFGELVRGALGDHFPTAIVRITHQDNSATEHMSNRFSPIIWKDVESFGSHRKKTDILFSTLYDVVKTWGSEGSSATTAAK